MEIERLTKEENIKSTLIRDLKNTEHRVKYLEILEKRIAENKKAIASIFLVLVLCGFAFQLLLQTKISEVTIGPFKISDTNIIMAIIPTVFTFSYYKYLMIWYDFVEQKNVYKVLTSLIFDIKYESYLNDRIRPFSITDSVSKYHTQEKWNFTGCLSYLLWIPIGLTILLFPFIYEFYLIYEIINNANSISGLNLLFVIAPILIIIFTILMLVKVIEKGLKEKY